MADKKLVGQNYSTPELVAKVTGRAKYAEDYRAEGMLFARLLLSPMPHARVKSIDASEATGGKAVSGAREDRGATKGTGAPTRDHAWLARPDLRCRGLGYGPRRVRRHS